MHIHKSDKFSKRSEKDSASSNKKANQYFSAAVILARKGRYAEAGNLLQKALDAGECTEVQALDLQARIYAQQGLHLEAEACWRKANALDRSSSFDESIERLRRARPSIDRFYKAMGGLLVFAIFSLLLWQVGFVNYDLKQHLAQTENSLEDIRRDIAAFQKDSGILTQQVASAVTEVDHALQGHETQIMATLKNIPTVSEIAENRKTIIDSVQVAIVEVGNTVSEIEANSQSRDQEFAASVAGLDSRLRGLHERLLKQLNTLPTISSTAQDRDAIIEKTDKALDQVGELVADMDTRLARQVKVLGSELSQLSAEVKELKNWQINNSAMIENAGVKKPE